MDNLFPLFIVFLCGCAAGAVMIALLTKQTIDDAVKSLRTAERVLRAAAEQANNDVALPARRARADLMERSTLQ